MDMEDEPITAAAPVTGAEQAQPTEPVAPAPAEPTTVDNPEPQAPTEPTGNEGRTNDAQPDELSTWAQKKGLELTSDNEKKLAKMAYESEKRMHETTTKAKATGAVDKTLGEMSDVSAENVANATGQDVETVKRLQRLETSAAIRDFWTDNPDARKYETEMAKIASEAGLYGTPQAILKAAYAMAVSQDTASLKTAGGREALETLARTQQAAVPNGHATNQGTTPTGKKFEDLSLEEMTKKLGTVRY
jgi:hypothetical protein